jgi:hypothetical protein
MTVKMCGEENEKEKREEKRRVENFFASVTGYTTFQL